MVLKITRRSRAIAMILLALSITMPTTFSMAAADQDTATSQAITAKININSAGQAQLQEMPGMGPVNASTIEAYPNDNGAFTQIDQLTNIKRVGSVTQEKIKPYITI